MHLEEQCIINPVLNDTNSLLLLISYNIQKINQIKFQKHAEIKIADAHIILLTGKNVLPAGKCILSYFAFISINVLWFRYFQWTTTNCSGIKIVFIDGNFPTKLIFSKLCTGKRHSFWRLCICIYNSEIKSSE